MPIAAVRLLDGHREWFTRCGVAETEGPRRDAFCAHAILEQDVQVVEDATGDPCYRDHPKVTEHPGIRFYAGAPLRLRGLAVGALCVKDHRPRRFSSTDAEVLRHLAEMVVHEMKHRLLEGQLRHWERKRHCGRMKSGRRLLLDVSNLYHADHAGLAMLKRLRREGV